jgi:hypothetical protein
MFRMRPKGDRRDSGLHIRPTPSEKEDAQRALEQHGRELGDYLRACMVLVAKHPRRALANVKDTWPEPRPRGRPAGGEPADDIDGASGPT